MKTNSSMTWVMRRTLRSRNEAPMVLSIWYGDSGPSSKPPTVAPIASLLSGPPVPAPLYLSGAFGLDHPFPPACIRAPVTSMSQPRTASSPVFHVQDWHSIFLIFLVLLNIQTEVQYLAFWLNLIVKYVFIAPYFPLQWFTRHPL